MRRSSKSEGLRQAEILRAEGEKQSQILAAEGRKEAAFRDAEARERSAEAEARQRRWWAKRLRAAIWRLQFSRCGEIHRGAQMMATAPNQKVIIVPIEGRHAWPARSAASPRSASPSSAMAEPARSGATTPSIPRKE